LLASKNPTNEIAAKILLHGGYDPCSELPANATIWTDNPECDDGFVPDFKNKYCYILSPEKNNLKAGENYCKDNYDSEFVTFDSNAEVDGFHSLISTGKWLISSYNYMLCL
jgi:hypothetical protein